MFQGVVSETLLEGLVLGLRPRVLPGVTALARTSLVVPGGVEAPHPDPRTKVREDKKNSTDKEVDKWFVCFRTTVITSAIFSLLQPSNTFHLRCLQPSFYGLPGRHFFELEPLTTLFMKEIRCGLKLCRDYNLSRCFCYAAFGNASWLNGAPSIHCHRL